MTDTEQTRSEIADRYGLPATVLRGDTREQLEAHAAELKGVIAEPRELTAAEIVDHIANGDREADDIVNQALSR